MTDMEELAQYRALGLSLEELQEYAKAKKEYRTGVFPVFVGQQAWVIDNGTPVLCSVIRFSSKVIGNWKVTLRAGFSHNWLMHDYVRTYTREVTQYGKSWFSTLEDANVAIKKEKEIK